VDAIYYACIYDWDFEWIRFSEPFLRFPWVGLYLQAISYRMPGQPNPLTGKVPSPKQMFGGRLCKGIDLLDEGIVNQVAQTIGKPVMALPDLVDARRAGRAEDRVLSENLKRFADGRPIVGLFGHLKKSKGILSFLEAARMPGASGICFALAGELVWPSGEGERNRIERALAECPNVWNHLARVPGERPLNELMAACDVLCAAYLDFPHSSAIQSKAAVFEKPLIVSEGYLMAERTRRFRMGEIVPQDDAVALLEAILRITKDSAAWVAENCPHWAEYTREHSFERFKTNVAKVLALTPETADCES